MSAQEELSGLSLQVCYRLDEVRVVVVPEFLPCHVGEVGLELLHRFDVGGFQSVGSIPEGSADNCVPFRRVESAFHQTRLSEENGGHYSFYLFGCFHISWSLCFFFRVYLFLALWT